MKMTHDMSFCLPWEVWKMIWYTVSEFKLGIIGWLVIWSKKPLHYGPSATALSGEGIIWQKSGTVVCSMPSVLSSLLTAVHGPSPVAAHFEWQRKRNHLVFDLSATIKETLHLFFSFCATWAPVPFSWKPSREIQNATQFLFKTSKDPY